MISLKLRSYQKELLDSENIPFADIRQNMKELNIINTHLGGHSISIDGIKKILKNSPGNKPITVCEIGCGGGDNIKAIEKWCHKNSIKASFIGIDIKTQCIAFAKQQYPSLDVKWITADYRDVTFENSKPDIIFSSLFCHHFADNAIIYMLQWMKANATKGFFINDLHRHPLAYYSIKIITRIFSGSYLVKNDAPLSVARGFTMDEWKTAFNEAGISNCNIQWKWAFRHLITFCVPPSPLPVESPSGDNAPVGGENDPAKYDVSIIGGGLAGLALSIQLKNKGYSVVLFEKEEYPFHKVCGEYISLESWNFLISLGMPLAEMDVPIIKKLMVSSPGGNYLEHDLPLGGFGISRYTLDNELNKIAVSKGVVLYDHCKVEEVLFHNEQFTLETTAGAFKSTVCCGSFGKRSNIDIKLGRRFITQKNNKLNNYIGVKYHIKTNFPADSIALHNFKNGYCGISKIEDDKYCLCYLTNAANLKENNNSIPAMEKNVLYKNKFLKEIFENSELLYKSPVTISQVSFSKKTQVENHILLAGDAAGMITPLCGNGMSMALHSSKIAANFIDAFLQMKISRYDMETGYAKKWRQTFSRRLATGRLIQKMFGKESVTNRFISFMKHFPMLTKALIKQTHGEPF